jgi:hypothetical protein
MTSQTTPRSAPTDRASAAHGAETGSKSADLSANDAYNRAFRPLTAAEIARLWLTAAARLAS